MSETANLIESQPRKAEVDASTIADDTSTAATNASSATETTVNSDEVTLVEVVAKPAEVSPKQDENKRTPAKRTPSKRMSFVERAQKESEELVKNLGGSLELEGGRRTRSSTRGTSKSPVAVTPPPAKRAKPSPATPKATKTPKTPKTPTTGSKGRGSRGRKISHVEIETAANEEENEQPGKEEDDEPMAEKAIEATENKKVSVEKGESKDLTDDSKVETNKRSVENSSPVLVEEGEEATETATEQSVSPVVIEEHAAADKSEVVKVGEEIVSGKPKEESKTGSESKNDETDTKLCSIAEVSESQSQDQVAGEQAVEVTSTKAENVKTVVGEVKNVSNAKVEEETQEESLSSKPETPVTDAFKDESNVTCSESTSTSIEAVATETSDKPNDETTPEPMEVDSSSKSNDVDMIPSNDQDGVAIIVADNSTERMDIVADNNDDNAVADIPRVTATPALSEVSSATEQTDSSVELINNVNETSPAANDNDNSNSNQNNGASVDIAPGIEAISDDADSNTNPEENHELNISSGIVTDVSTLENSNNLNAEINKNEPDSCESKVTSIPISSDGAAAVPATNCN